MGTWTTPLDGGSLAAALLRAADWCNEALLARLEQEGWPPLSRGHAQVFVNLDEDGTRPAELARRIGITRQSVHGLVGHLVEHELLETVPHPTDGRSQLVRLAPRGRDLAAAAGAILAEIERELTQRIGDEAMAGLREALSRPWGPPPGPAAP